MFLPPKRCSFILITPSEISGVFFFLYKCLLYIGLNGLNLEKVSSVNYFCSSVQRRLNFTAAIATRIDTRVRSSEVNDPLRLLFSLLLPSITSQHESSLFVVCRSRYLRRTVISRWVIYHLWLSFTDVRFKIEWTILTKWKFSEK